LPEEHGDVADRGAGRAAVVLRLLRRGRPQGRRQRQGGKRENSSPAGARSDNAHVRPPQVFVGWPLPTIFIWRLEKMVGSAHPTGVSCSVYLRACASIHSIRRGSL